MDAVLDWLRHADADVARAVHALRWAPLTAVMELLSSWWVKGPGFVLAALAVDVARSRAVVGRRGFVPVCALAVLAAILVATLLGDDLLKPLVGRLRPPRDHLGLTAIVTLPLGPSFPSGHATQSFAVATCLGLLAPRLRTGALALATLIALSRVYLGVHFPSDVLAGALLGALVGWGVARVAQASSPGGSTDSAEPATRIPTSRP